MPAVDMNYLIGFCIAGQGVSPEAMQNNLQQLAPSVEANSTCEVGS